MIDITPFHDKLDKLREYMWLFIKGLEGKSIIKNMAKLNIGYGISEYINHTCVLRVSPYEDKNMWIMPFEEWLQLNATQHNTNH